MPKVEPKILLYDLEITPMLGWAYSLWDARIIHTERSSYIMCFAYKWLGDDEIHTVSLTDFPLYKRDKHNDKHVVEFLHQLFDEADVVIAHNAIKFDNRVAQERFLHHGLQPPSPFKTVDTLAVAKRYFKFPSNSLDNLCQALGLGCKSAVRHSDLWRDCVDGNMEAWEKMLAYNKNDISMLESLYLRLRPYIVTHPNLSNYGDSVSCPKCGSNRVQRRGYARTNVSTFQRYQCQDCGGWSRKRLRDKSTIPPELTNVS